MGKTNNNFKKTENRGKGNKGYGKSKGKRSPFDSGASNTEATSRDTTKLGSTYGGNDISWYTRYKDMVEPAAKIPFPYVPGRKLKLTPPDLLDRSGGVSAESEYTWYYPGIMGLYFYPSVGRSEDITSPINIAAREIYGRIRSKYSGSLEADAPDIMMYIIAVDSLYMFIEDMKRAYYLINQYTPYNNYFPTAALRVAGWDADDLRENRTLFFQYINEAIAMASKFKIPGSMDLIKRHQFMCANVYADAPSLKSQNYMFCLQGAYYLSETATTTELSIRGIHDFDGQGMTVAEAWETFNEMISKITEWDTSYTILGYLMRAFEESEFVIPAPVLEDGILNPVYNDEVLLQIQNAITIPVKSKDMKITQDVLNNNTILHTPKLQSAAFGGNNIYGTYPREALLTVPGDYQPSTDTVIYATRLAALGDADGNVDCGTEIIQAMHVVNNANGLYQYSIPYNTLIVGRPDTSFENNLKALGTTLEFCNILESFDRHPTYQILYSTYSGSSPKWHFATCIGTENVTSVDVDTLANLHRMCIYSEFNCFGLL